jgi:nicotinamide-nucleotide amidase
MMEGVVLRHIENLFGRQPLFRETFRTTGIGESNMAPLVQPIFDRFPEFVFSSLPHIGGVDIVVTQKVGDDDPATVRARAAEFEGGLVAALGERLFARGEDELETVIGDELARRGETLAVAESLTGGLIGKRITDTPGSSRYLLVDVVAYSNDCKASFLGVLEASLEKHGAVSEVVCSEMAAGIRQRTGATYGLATTGIAGPSGGRDDKPVGLTYYGLSWEGGIDVRHRVFPGNREDVRERVTYASLFLLHQRMSAPAKKNRT